MKRLIFSSLLCTLAAAAAPVQWTTASGGNGHWYELVSTPTIFVSVNLATAQADAAARTHLGQQGYLATVTSAAENNFLLDTFSILIGFGGNGSAWLGASDEAVPGELRWLGGPEAGQALTFTNFAAGHPAFTGSTDGLVLFEGILQGQWATVDGGALGYFVEYNDAPPSGVPEPSTLATLGAALIALARYRGGFKRR